MEAIVLSDILGDPLDMIASGPAAPDSSTCAQAIEIALKYGLRLSGQARSLLEQETPRELGNVHSQVIGSVRELCRAGGVEAAGLQGAVLISVGSDGTDGPTDAAGGYVDGDTLQTLKDKGMDLQAYLDNNDAYHALQAAEGLIFTGPTGTNVNDLTIGLIRPEDI